MAQFSGNRATGNSRQSRAKGDTAPLHINGQDYTANQLSEESYMLSEQDFDILQFLAKPEKLSYDDLRYIAKTFLPKMHSYTCKVPPLLLTVPLFAVTRDAAPVDVVWHRKGDGFLGYAGPALTQSHATVLFVLINQAACFPPMWQHRLSFSKLLLKMGWSRNSRNYGRVKEILTDLKEAKLCRWAEAESIEYSHGQEIRFLFDWTVLEKGNLEFRLHNLIMPLFDYNLTYLNFEKRKNMRDGIETFLFGYFSSNSCKLPFTYKEIHTACGSQAKSLKDFSKTVRVALESMMSKKIIKNFSVKKGKIRVFK